MNFSEVFVGHVGVDLRGDNRGVAKELLDRADISAVI